MIASVQARVRVASLVVASRWASCGVVWRQQRTARAQRIHQQQHRKLQENARAMGTIPVRALRNRSDGSIVRSWCMPEEECFARRYHNTERLTKLGSVQIKATFCSSRIPLLNAALMLALHSSPRSPPSPPPPPPTPFAKTWLILFFLNHIAKI